MLQKPQIVAFSKLDLPATRQKLKKEMDIFNQKGIEIFAFSAATGEGVSKLLGEMIFRISDQTPTTRPSSPGMGPGKQGIRTEEISS